MENNFFMNQMEEETKTNLIFPFHIDKDKLLGNFTFNFENGNEFHKHYYSDVLRVAQVEPYAFYFTKEDEEFYSVQEIEFITKVQKIEIEKLNKGYELITLELEEETINYLNIYKKQHNLTTEQAITTILKEMIEYCKRRETEWNSEETS